jgi:hypothetical protein
MLRKIGIIAVLALMVLALAAVPALAQSVHFVTGGGNAPTATGPNADTSDLVLTGKVAGLGGTTFEIEATANCTANYACQNRGGEFPNDPKKQSVSAIVGDTTGPLPTPKNGSFRFRLTLEAPESTLTCPGRQVVVLTSVSYTNVLITLEEDGVESDRLTIPGTFSFTYFTDVP